MNIRLLQGLLVAFIILLTALGLRQPGAASVSAAGSPEAVRAQMQASLEDGFLQAADRRVFTFPADHHAHPGYRSEWWYLTGQLQSPEGRRFGVQWTLFRSQLLPEPAPSLVGNPWQSDAAYMLHTAISDLGGQGFFTHEAFARASGGIAGATTGSDDGSVRVWLDADSFTRAADGTWRLQAQLSDGGYDLRLQPTRPPVLNGEAGLSRKGGGEGNASYYYSWPFLQAVGEVQIGAERHAVSGDLWLDREWSTSALEPGQQGWDWLALHLHDGRSLMVYRIREADGSAGPFSTGTLAAADGGSTNLRREDFTFTPSRWWQSPASGRRYPLAWRLQIPHHGIDYRITTPIEGQEHRGLFPYWEGLVEARDAASLTGSGYLELVGYP